MIRICGNNEPALTVASRLERNFPRLVVRVEECLKKCGPCRERPFALVDGELMVAADADGLYQEIVDRINVKPR